MPPSAIDHVSMACGHRRDRLRAALGQVLQRRQRCFELRDKSGRGIELGVGERQPRIGAMQRGRFVWREISQARCGMSSSASSSPAVPCFGRGPRRIARSSAATPRASSFARWVLEQRQQRHRRDAAERRLGAQAARTRRPAVSASAGPRESSAGTFQRASSAITRRPSPTSGVTSAAVLPGSSIASRNATAMASASSSALAASITAMVFIAASACAAKPISARRSFQRSLAAAGRKRFRDEHSRPCGAATSV